MAEAKNWRNRIIGYGVEAPDQLLAKLAEDAGLTAPSVDFKEYGEDTADDVEYCTCPSCGHKFPK